MNKTRTVKVNSFNRENNIIEFQNSWFHIDDIIINKRTNKKYHIDTIHKDNKTMVLIGCDEWSPYDIKKDDWFSIDRGNYNIPVKYKPYTKEELKKVVNEVFKDYKDPTIGMGLEMKKAFHEAMKKEAEKWIKDYNDRNN